LGLVLVAAFLLFGRRKFATLMGDIGQGLRGFRNGLTRDSRLTSDLVTDRSTEPLTEEISSHRKDRSDTNSHYEESMGASNARIS
jgi:TatA/E family protein of Tat protein translocase